MQCRIFASSEYLNGATDDIQEIMTRYMHFGELTYNSIVKVFLEVSNNLYNPPAQHTLEKVASKELIKRQNTQNR
jgi:hypothetical protein